jgi:chromosome segregation ATPase
VCAAHGQFLRHSSLRHRGKTYKNMNRLDFSHPQDTIHAMLEGQNPLPQQSKNPLPQQSNVLGQDIVQFGNSDFQRSVSSSTNRQLGAANDVPGSLIANQVYISARGATNLNENVILKKSQVIETNNNLNSVKNDVRRLIELKAESNRRMLSKKGAKEKVADAKNALNPDGSSYGSFTREQIEKANAELERRNKYKKNNGIEDQDQNDDTNVNMDEFRFGDTKPGNITGTDDLSEMKQEDLDKNMKELGEKIDFAITMAMKSLEEQQELQELTNNIIKKLSDQVTESEKNFEDVNSKLINAEKNFKDVNSKLINAEKNLQTSEESNKKLQKELGEIIDLLGNASDGDENITSVLTKVTRMKQNLDDSAKTIEDLKVLLDKKEEEIRGLKEENVAVKEENVELKKKKKELEKGKNKVEEDNKILSEKLAEAGKKLLDEGKSKELQTEENAKLKEEIAKLKENHRNEINELTQKHGAAIKEKDKEITTLNEQHGAEIKEKDKEITTLNEQHGAALNELTQKHGAALNVLKEKHKNEINVLKQQHMAALNELKQKHENEINVLKQQHMAALNELTQKHATEINGLNEKHGAEIAELNEQNTTLIKEINELNEQHKKEITTLKQQHEAAIQEKENEIKKLLEVQIKNNITISNLEKEVQENTSKISNLDQTNIQLQGKTQQQSKEIERLKEENRLIVEKAKEEARKEVEKAKEEARKEVEKAREEARKEVEKAREEAEKARKKAEEESKKAAELLIKVDDITSKNAPLQEEIEELKLKVNILKSSESRFGQKGEALVALSQFVGVPHSEIGPGDDPINKILEHLAPILESPDALARALRNNKKLEAYEEFKKAISSKKGTNPVRVQPNKQSVKRKK